MGNCNNWRGFTLLSVPSKGLGRVFIVRIRDALDNKLRKEQVGFRRGKGCMQQILILRNIIDQGHEWNSPLFINYVDFSKAFDSIHIHYEILWNSIQNYQSCENVLQNLKMCS